MRGGRDDARRLLRRQRRGIELAQLFAEHVGQLDVGGIELAIDPADPDPLFDDQQVHGKECQDGDEHHDVHQRVRRARSDRVRLRFRGCSKLVPRAAPGPNDRLASRTIELPAEPLDMHVDHIRQRIVVVVPDVLGDVAAADDVPGAPREVLEQRVFLGAQRNLAIADEDAAAARLDGERAGDQALRQNRLVAAPDDGAKARQQLAEVVGLGQVVVGAAVEPLDP